MKKAEGVRTGVKCEEGIDPVAQKNFKEITEEEEKGSSKFPITAINVPPTKGNKMNE